MQFRQQHVKPFHNTPQHHRGQHARKWLEPFLSLIVLLSMTFGAPAVPAYAGPSPTGATIASDLEDYAPGSFVTLTGAGWAPGEAVHIFVNDDAGQSWSLNTNPDPIADASGALFYQFQLPYTFIANYSVTATGATSGLATAAFTDANSSANLDQCANDPAPSPNTDGCSASATDWVNGNLGASKSVYLEGDSIPYRLVFDNLSLASHTVTIEWDTTKSGTHALDYLTSYNRTVATANPCLGVSACNAAVFNTFAIPKDPQVDNGAGSPISQLAGVFTLFGGTITGVSAYAYPGGAGFAGDKTARITITFVASRANPVLAWGGHIATRNDWGLGNSAVAISGSPYHTALNNLDGAGGNQDRSLSADAVIFPASITTIKDATPNSATPFQFTASPAPLSNFSLVDDGTAANTKVFANIIDFKAYSVAETVPAGWTLTGIVCSVTSVNGGTQTVTPPSVSINLKEGENVTCTYNNSRDTGSLKLSKTLSGGPAGYSGPFTINYDCDGTAFDGSVSVSAGGSQTINGIPTGTSCTINETLPTAPAGYTFGTPTFSPAATVQVTTKGSTVEVTTNNTLSLNQGYLKITKSFDPLSSGFGGTFAIVYNCGAGSVTANLAAGASTTVGPFATGTQCTVTEPTLPAAPAGWTFGTPVVTGSPATIGAGNAAAAVQVTVANSISRDQGYLKITKSFDPLTSGFAGTFAIVYDCGAGPLTVNLAAGASTSVGPLNTGTQCTVTEPTLPAAPAGWTFGTPVVTGSPATIVKGDAATAVQVTVANSISRDLGYLKITKSFDPLTSGFAGTFAIVYDCGAGPVTVNLAAGASTTVGPFGAGTQCTLTEPTLPAAPAGWTYGTPVVTGSPAIIVKGDAAAAVQVTVANSISREVGSLKITKITNNPDGATLPAAFTGTYDCGVGYTGSWSVANGGSQTINGIPTGNTCSVTEDALASISGYTWDTPNFTPSSIVVSSNGGTFEIVVGNSITRDRGYLTIVKKVVNDNGGSATVGDFGLASSAGTLTFDGGAASGNTTTYTSQKITVGTGDYSLTENDVAGYGEGSWSCTGNAGAMTPLFSSGSVAIGKGEDVVCTITNDDQQAYLTLVKTVVNDNGGSAGADAFARFIDGNLVQWSVAVPVNPGPHTASETTLAGYTASNWGGDCAANGTVSVSLGQSKTCTITNDDIAPKLHLRKVVITDNGGAATEADFSLTADGTGSNDLSGISPVDSGASLKADTWALSETSLAGYSASAWSCVGGTQSGNSISVGIGGEATCTITNDDIAPKLHLRKVVVNDNGGTATEADFSLTADGTGSNDLSGISPVDSGAGLKSDTWTLSETSLAGYSASTWSCVGGTQSGNQITVGIGGEATCAITNSDQPAHLRLVKTVINDNGGTAAAIDFTLSAAGPSSISGAGGVDSNVKAGTYVLNETNLPGYAARAWICVGDGEMVAGNAIKLALGDSATCTITNDDIAPKLHLRKQIINDNGGTATEADFTLTADGAGANDLSGLTPVDSSATLQADTWTLSESGPAGYSASAWSCVGGTQSGNSISVAIGGEATCTIVNNDQPAHLTLVKTVTNDDGGKAIATDFTLSASGPTALSGAGGADGDVSAGTYNLSETTLPGYTAGAWSCAGGTQSGNSISLALGQSATCTINNDDQAAHLTLVKIVTNDNGGTAVATDFMLSASGSTPLSGAGGASANVNAGVYHLSELGVTGYAAGTWNCVGGTVQSNGVIDLALGESAICTIKNDDIQPKLTVTKIVVNNNGGTKVIADFPLNVGGVSVNSGEQNSFNAGSYTVGETNLPGYSASISGDCAADGSVTLAVGDVKACTITNDDQAATLIVRKVVVNENGGTKVAQDFSFQVNGNAAVAFEADGENVLTVDAGTYNVSEPAAAGYTTSYVGCSSIVIPPGGTATCTITNDDIQPKLTVTKIVTNDNGGTKAVIDFPLNVSGTPVTSGDQNGFNAGSYTVGETNQPGYSATIGGDCAADGSITLAVGEVKACTITNDDRTAHLKLVKKVLNNNGGTAVAGDWTLTADGATDYSGAAGFDLDVNAGTYALSESTGPAGYTASPWSCSNGSSVVPGVVKIGLDESVVCEIVNDDNAPQLTLVKTVINNNGGTAVASDWTLTAAGYDPISPDAGTYVLSESGPAGYTQTSLTCDNAIGPVTQVTLGLGDNVTCTFVNDDIAPKLTLVKTVINDNGGTAVSTDWTLTAAGYDPVSPDAGTYALSESGPAGYTQTSLTCSDAPGEVTQVTLSLGEDVTCTFVNDDQSAHLKLIKTVTIDNGGTAAAADWTLTADGAKDYSGAGGFDLNVDAGTYALSESAGPAGYTSGGFDCGATVTLAPGEYKTCTINNDDQTAHLKLVKTVTNDNGGTAEATAWTLTADGAKDYSGAGGFDLDVDAGTYALSESAGPAGYTSGGFDCGTSVTLAPGETKTCTINNNDQTAHLTLVKNIVNDNGGTAAATGFTLSASGPTPISGAGGADGDVKAGVYDLSETSLPGYTASGWTCSGGTVLMPGKIQLALGQSATCEITNDDRTAHLTLVKKVINDNGGTAVAADWMLTADGGIDYSGAGGFDKDVNAGSYSLSESAGPAGYAAGTWSCSGGSSMVPGQIALKLGESAVCEIVNDDIAPKLIVIKHVINDNGGTKTAADFTLDAGGANDSPDNFAGAESPGTVVTLDAGSYQVQEEPVAGYAASYSADCSGTAVIGATKTCTVTNDDIAPKLTLVKTVINDNGGTATAGAWTLAAAGYDTISPDAGKYALSESGGPAGYNLTSLTCSNATGQVTQVTLGLGENVTCTFVNDDKAPKLTLVKTVINDNGGTAAASAWTLTAAGYDTASPDAGTYNLSESGGPAGYNLTSLTCSNATGQVTKATLGLGEEVTCTFVNDDIAPKLHLRKVVINDNGGTKTVADFTLTANGVGTNDLSGSSPVDSGAGLKADTWALSENAVYGYTASAWSCVGGTQSGSDITLGIGQEATCTITNDDQPGKIIVIKNAKPANGSFAFTTTGTGYSGFSLTGATTGGGNQNTATLNAGTYTVKETSQLGWILTGIGGSTDPNTPYACTVTGSGGSSGAGDLNTQSATISLKNGDTVTCVFENTGLGVTRTQGFWATHPQLAQIAWFGGTAFGHTFPGVAGTAGIGDNLICGRPIDTLGKLMGGFWSDVSKTSTGAKRSALDQARMQLLQQLLAAELNASAFGTVPAGGIAKFAAWESALCGTNTTAIKNAQQEAASFNTSGDGAAFTPGTSADSKYARAIADNPFWNIIKP